MNPKIRASGIRGARTIVAMLPNGSSVWMKVRPALVSIRDLDQLVASLDRTHTHHAQTFHSNAAAFKLLTRSVKRDTSKVSQMQLRANRKLNMRILAGDAKLARRIDDSLMPVIRRAKADQKQHKMVLRSGYRRDLWNQLVLVSAAPLMAAYGQRSNPLAVNNLVIVIALGVWLVSDEISDMLLGKRTMLNGSIRDMNMWSYTAPFANLLTCWWLLKDRQHERFVTGIAEDFKLWQGSPPERRLMYATVDLSSRIAPEHLPDFQGLKNVAALATIQSVEFAPDGVNEFPKVSLYMVAAMQEFLALVIVVSVSATPRDLIRLQVAWVVDTQGADCFSPVGSEQ